MNQQSDGRRDLPRTAYLEHTLRRARTAAGRRSHRSVTLDHLLLALLDDPDAAKLLQIAGADVAAIHGAAASAVNARKASLAGPDGAKLSFGPRFGALFQCAAEEAGRLGRGELDGALVLIAIAKDTESAVSRILAANGFKLEAALGALRKQAGPRPQPGISAPATEGTCKPNGKPEKSVGARLLQPARGGIAGLADTEDSMDAMIASVRSILEAEELKDLKVMQQTAPALRFEPPPKGNGIAIKPAAGFADAARPLEPRLGPSPRGMHCPDAAFRVAGFSDSGPAFDLELAAKAKKRSAPQRSAARGRGGGSALLSKILAPIPRKACVGVSQMVQIALTRDEAALIFGRTLQPKAREAAEGEAVCRAVTMRLSAPEGGFFIEALTPETQWLQDRSQEEAPLGWAWTVIAGAAGSSCLKASISARDVDASGAGGAIAAPDQVIKVRVRGNIWLSLLRSLRSLLWMLLGSGLTAAAWCALKVFGGGAIPGAFSG